MGRAGGIGRVHDIPWCYVGKATVIHRLTTDPSRQRSGLATHLMNFAEKMVATDGYGSIRLDAFTRNPVAAALYENRGYRRAGSVSFRKGGPSATRSW